MSDFESKTNATSAGGKALRALRTITNVRGHRVLMVELPGMTRPTYWRWHSGNGDEALFEQVEAPNAAQPKEQ